MKAGCADSGAGTASAKPTDPHAAVGPVVVGFPTSIRAPVRYGSNRGRSSVGTLPIRLREAIMGKYFLGWLLGVPAVVLVVLYFFFR